MAIQRPFLWIMWHRGGWIRERRAWPPGEPRGPGRWQDAVAFLGRSWDAAAACTGAPRSGAEGRAPPRAKSGGRHLGLSSEGDRNPRSPHCWQALPCWAIIFKTSSFSEVPHACPIMPHPHPRAPPVVKATQAQRPMGELAGRVGSTRSPGGTVAAGLALCEPSPPTSPSAGSRRRTTWPGFLWGSPSSG